MESVNTKPKSITRPLQRIPISDDIVKTINGWSEQIEKFCPGIQIKKQDFVYWLIIQKGEVLSTADLKSIKERFFDEIELAQWALGQLKAARGRNENLTLAQLLSGGERVRSVSKPKKSKEKQDELAHETLPGKAVAARDGGN